MLAKILIKTRMAADALGATMMDRPEWTGARPKVFGFDEIEVYCTPTNNRRGTTPVSSNLADGSMAAASARPPVDAVNPCADNVYGAHRALARSRQERHGHRL
ncbi:MAG: alkaline phosphatase PhoX [Aquabacterium sp.]|uniref:alkaline phosphatase PhoX n=1 Tax=Aquabacterium sp. TaxID=1872578 RepID=UPI003BB03754